MISAILGRRFRNVIFQATFYLVTAILATAVVVGCGSDSQGDIDDSVYLVTEQPALHPGDSVITQLFADRDFFVEEEIPMLESGRGLIISEIRRIDSLTASVVVTASESAEAGVHEFQLEQGGTVGQLSISVMNEPPGPGTVSAESATASAGADYARFTVRGQGTHFDSDILVTVEGAPGIYLEGVVVQSETQLEVIYSIDRDQEPTVASFVIEDGLYTYTVPFTVVSALILQNQAGVQQLQKGQAGSVTLSHPEAALHTATRLHFDDPAIEVGTPELISPTEIVFPVRAPFDSEVQALQVLASTHSQSGAFLQEMTVELECHEPAYLTFVPSRLPVGSTTHSVQLSAQGVDLTEVTDITLAQSSHVFLDDWAASDAASGSVDLSSVSVPAADGYLFTAEAPGQSVFGVIAIDEFTKASYPAIQQLGTGDHLYLPVVVTGGQMTQSNTDVLSSADFTVEDFTVNDPGSVIVELSVADNADEGLSNLEILIDGDSFNVVLSIVDSGI